jgi:predicted nucleic acid-binding protein
MSEEYSVDRIYQKELYETVCEIKEQTVYTDETLKEWLEILKRAKYTVAVSKKYSLMFRHVIDKKDIFVLYSKRPISTSLLLTYFKFNPDIISLIDERAFVNLRYKECQ